MKLTHAQRTWLVDRSDVRGRITCPGSNGFIKSSWQRVMERLRVHDLVQPNAHGEYKLTSKGEAYKEGALAAEIVWQKAAGSSWGTRSIDANILQRVSDVIGLNVHHPEETKLGAADRWADLRAGRAFARYRVLPRHDLARRAR